MDPQRQNFLRHIGQTSDSPLMLDIEKAEGIYLYSKDGKIYRDMISGISVNNLGHRHPNVIKAIREQLEKYLHVMVYGEYIQDPTVDLARYLASILPENLSTVYFVNSGSEAVEGALKLAKRFTVRNEIIAFKNAYHGSTHGALSVMGNEEFRNAFRPLVPGVRLLGFNRIDQVDKISSETACVLIEPIQGEAGVQIPEKRFLQRLRERCNETGALLIFDEVQTGFGRTGTYFAFESFQVVPDIITLAKGLGGGMPIGAFVTSNEIMSVLKSNPVLGHITTFGGHPVSCAAALASARTLKEDNIIESIPAKEKLFRDLLKHKEIKSLRGKGLFFAMEMSSHEQVKRIVENALSRGIVFDWFLFCPEAIRIAPPLIITEEQIVEAVPLILESIEESRN